MKRRKHTDSQISREVRHLRALGSVFLRRLKAVNRLAVELLVQCVDVTNERLFIRAIWTVFPFSAVTDAADLVVQAYLVSSAHASKQPPSPTYRATLCHIRLGATFETRLQHINRIPTIILTQALIELVKVEAVLQSAVMDELALGDVGVLARQAHGEAEVELGVRVEVGGAQLEHVPQALGLAVLALDAVVVVGWRANVREREADARAQVCHDGKNQVAQAVARVGALGPGEDGRVSLRSLRESFWWKKERT